MTIPTKTTIRYMHYGWTEFQCPTNILSEIIEESFKIFFFFFRPVGNIVGVGGLLSRADVDGGHGMHGYERL